MGLWSLVGFAAVVVLAAAVDGQLDEPDWFAAAPRLVRVAGRTLLLLLLLPLLIVGLGAAALFWQIMGALALALGILWLAYKAIVWVLEVLQSGDGGS